MPTVLDQAQRPPAPECPTCGEPLTYVETEVSSEIHFYDCDDCGTCWKLGTRLMPDPVRQIKKDTTG
jgi:hypothetical protein